MGEAKSDALLTLLNYTHDIIPFLATPLISRYDEFAELYLRQLSLRDISLRAGIPLSTIRSVLVAGGMVMRSNKKVQESSTFISYSKTLKPP